LQERHVPTTAAMYKNFRDVVIIGAGASGLMCAIECGKRGRSVSVLDHAPRIGSKVLVSGGGRSNFSNANAASGHYLSLNPHFCKSALARFSPQDFVAMLEKNGIGYHEEDSGRFFLNRSSSEIVSMLRKECDDAGVEIRLNCRIAGVGKEDSFVVETTHGVFLSGSLVIATGGLSFPELGATGIGHRIARQFGLEVIPTSPGLVPFTFGARDLDVFAQLSGISVDSEIRCGKRRFRGNVLFTHKGLSGPAILQTSLYWRRGDAIIVDLAPETDILALFLKKSDSRMEMKTFLSGFFPKRFAGLWCDLHSGSKPMNRYSSRELSDIAHRLHNWKLVPVGTEGYKKAEVTIGGVDTAELSSRTMEAGKQPGLYFIGEVVDVTGQLGGFNLHWAWASGHAAGQYA
jgi:predicted Rossmann fold flavoprotein